MACSTTGYTGQNYCNRNSRFGKPTGLIFATDEHTNTAADFLLEATWINDVQNEKVFPLHYMKNFEDLSTEAAYYDYPDGSRKRMDQGRYRFAAHFDLNECIKKQLVNFRGNQDGIYMVYGDVIRGRTIDSGVNIVPIRLSDVNIEKETLPGMDAPGMVRVVIDLEDHKDLNEYDYSREMTWDVSDLDGLTEVTITQVTASATTLVVDVTANCGGDTKPITGLGTEITDWEMSDGDGTITGVTESTTVNGRYTLTGTAFATGELDLAEPEDRSDDVLVISSGPATITVDE